MLKNYLSHVAEREALGIPPLPLDAKQTKDLTELLEKPDQESIKTSYLIFLLIEFLLELIKPLMSKRLGLAQLLKKNQKVR